MAAHKTRGADQADAHNAASMSRPSLRKANGGGAVIMGADRGNNDRINKSMRMRHFQSCGQ
eukprot:15043388-Alexandrium_andersonii.AAC.1